MNRQTEIILSGVGGQGMILCGTMIAEAAVLHDKKKATVSSEYGVETRGTFSKSDVIISDSEIYFQEVTEPDLIICLAQPAYERYSGTYDGILMVYNEAEVKADPERGEFEYGINIGKLSLELGNPGVANILTMGIVIGFLDAVTVEGAKEALDRIFGKKGEKILCLNFKAFNKGIEIGKEFRERFKRNV